MTGARIIKEFFKKYFNIDAHGNSVISVLNDVVQNNDSLGGGGGGQDVLIIDLESEYINHKLILPPLPKTGQEIWDFINNGGAVYIRVSTEGDKFISILTNFIHYEFSSAYSYHFYFQPINNNEIEYIAGSMDEYPVFTGVK